MRDAVVDHWDNRLAHFVAEIENQKIFSSDLLFRKVSFIYETGGFFSP